jgi:hypothetical protein
LPIAYPHLKAYQDIVTVAVLGPLSHLLKVFVGAALGLLLNRMGALLNALSTVPQLPSNDPLCQFDDREQLIGFIG